MKTLFTLLTLTISVSSFAQERVVLNGPKVTVNSSEATVVRTNQTPDNVEITFQVPMENSVCERQNFQDVYTTSGYDCGYYTTSRVVYYGRGQRGVQYYNYPRSCMVRVAYCAQYGVSYQTERDTMKIKFKNLRALGDSESETFSIRAMQKRVDSGSVNYTVTPVETLGQYSVEKKKALGLFNTTYVVEEN